MMISHVRRVVFNPTSCPGLRCQRGYIQTAKSSPKSPSIRANGFKSRGVRNESTATGEDRTGHIVAHANEGILFFDSELLVMLVARPLYLMYSTM